MKSKNENTKSKFKNLLSLKKIGRLFFNIFLILPGLFFLFTGFQWLVSPESAASNLAMPMLAGAGLGSQIGDIGGLFMAMGLLTMTAVTFRKRDLLFSVAILLSCISVYRFFAFSLHDATLTMQSMILEIVLAIWFFVASRKLPQKEQENE
jgi:hypothetical protein